MNIIDKYKESGQLIIAIAGPVGTGKSAVAKHLCQLFKLKCLKLDEFPNKDFKEKITLKNGKELTNIDSIDYYDWKEFNNKVEEMKTEGVIIYGIGFPRDKITFKIDMYIFLKISKQNLLMARAEYAKAHPDRFKGLEEFIGSEEEKLILNKMTLPSYYKIIETSDINKFVNLNEVTKMDEILKSIQKYIYKYVQDTIYRNRKDLKFVTESESYEYAN